jgi:hypothetical protein
MICQYKNKIATLISVNDKLEYNSCKPRKLPHMYCVALRMACGRNMERQKRILELRVEYKLYHMVQYYKCALFGYGSLGEGKTKRVNIVPCRVFTKKLTLLVFAFYLLFTICSDVGQVMLRVQFDSISCEDGALH